MPSYAKNDVAIWMDYDPVVIDRELGYAERLNLNTVRVFLNQAVYEHEPKVFWSGWRTSLHCARSTRSGPCSCFSIPVSIRRSLI